MTEQRREEAAPPEQGQGQGRPDEHVDPVVSVLLRLTVTGQRDAYADRHEGEIDDLRKGAHDATAARLKRFVLPAALSAAITSAILSSGTLVTFVTPSPQTPCSTTGPSSMQAGVP